MWRLTRLFEEGKEKMNTQRMKRRDTGTSRRHHGDTTASLRKRSARRLLLPCGNQRTWISRHDTPFPGYEDRCVVLDQQEPIAGPERAAGQGLKMRCGH